jgi:hypothetical protein
MMNFGKTARVNFSGIVGSGSPKRDFGAILVYLPAKVTRERIFLVQ